MKVAGYYLGKCLSYREKLMKVVIFGLGVHGGGSGAARYFAERGDDVLITDLRSSTELAGAIDALAPYHCRYRLGYHRAEDFLNADLVVKNPAIPPGHPMLALNSNICSDFSFILPQIDLPVIAVTGTKGKSTVVAATAFLLEQYGYNPVVVGNIGISPFTLLEKQIAARAGRSIVIAELSSWQLRDLQKYDREAKSQFSVSVVTSLFPDHMNTYTSFNEYVDDKRVVLQHLAPGGSAILPIGVLETLTRQLPRFPQQIIPFDWKTISITYDATKHDLSRSIPPHLLPVIGIGATFSIPLAEMTKKLNSFPGLPHRQQLVGTYKRITLINDSAATVPEAVNYACESLNGSIHLITGGTDKELQPRKMLPACRLATSLTLLAGSFTDTLIPLLQEHALAFQGPFKTMQEACSSAWEHAERDKHATRFILMSPGSASFEMFQNEFDRGDQYCSWFARMMKQ